MDSKKKEELGSLYRKGVVLTQQALESYDHDFQSLSNGKIIPHGLHDIIKNQAFINIGVSKDTAEFVLDCLLNWWEQIGKNQYGDKNKLLILCDGGGSNNSRHYVFKEAMQAFANQTRLEVRIAHYPPDSNRIGVKKSNKLLIINSLNNFTQVFTCTATLVR